MRKGETSIGWEGGNRKIFCTHPLLALYLEYEFCRAFGGGQGVSKDNCVIHSGSPHSDTKDIAIGDEVHVGHGAVINGYKIGNNVLIGMNATILHDAEIGNACIIGANCLVGEGMKIPDDSFVVGVPGKIKGKVSSDQSFWVEDASKSYAKVVKLYKEQGGL